MFLMDGSKATVSSYEKIRVQTIAYFLNKWDLVNLVEPSDIKQIEHEKLEILPKRDMSCWKINHKWVRQK